MKNFNAKGLTINFGHIEMVLAAISILLMFKATETPFHVAVLSFLVLNYIAIKNYGAIQSQLSQGRYCTHLRQQRKVMAVLFESTPQAIAIMDREIEKLENQLFKQLRAGMVINIFSSLLCLYVLYRLLTVLWSL